MHTTSPTMIASRNRGSCAPDWLTGVVPASTSSVVKIPSPTRSPKAKWMIPVSR
jgi:hypothetical protein